MQTTIDKKAFNRTVATLVIPMALQNLINVAVQSADVAMLTMVGEIPLSGVSLAGQIQFVMMLIFFGLASGASVLTAQYWGKGDVRTIEKVMAISLRLSMSVAVLFTAAAMLFPEALMRIFTPEPAVIAEGVKYLRFVAPGYLIIGFTNIYLNIMRSVERVLISTCVYAISLVSNIALNAVFIFGLLGFPAMGAAGAGLATTSARCIELCIVVVYAVRNPVLRLRRKDFFSRHKTLMKDFVKYALPTTLNEMLWGLGMSANAVIIGHMGAAAVAANSVGSVMRQLATTVSFGLANAAAIMIGKAIGAGEPHKAEAYAGRLVRLAFFTGLIGAGVIFCVRPILLSVLNLSPEALNYLGYLLIVLCIYVISQATTTCMIVGVFRGGGDPRFGLYLDILCMWCFSILWGAIGAFVFHWPVEAVFTILFADEIARIPLCIWRYRSKRWLKNVTRADTSSL